MMQNAWSLKMDRDVNDCGHDMEALFHPKDIALIGASANEGKIGNVIGSYLAAWPGKLYLVNPREKEIMGREVYQDISCLPDNLDLAIIALDAQRAVGFAFLSF
jgi:acetate---CoA ligase (ADP-forming)